MKKFVLGLCAALCAACSFADSPTLGWTFADGKITEVVNDGATPWKLNAVDLGNGNLKLDGGGGYGGLPAQAGTHGMIDLRTPITDTNGIPYNVTEMSGQCFRGRGDITGIRLPDTLTNIPVACFYACSNLETVEPFLPAAVTSLGWAAFKGCGKLHCDLVLRNPAMTMSNGSRYDESTFYQSGITSVDLSQTQLTSLPLQCFRESKSLLWAKMPATLTAFSATFHQCTSMYEIEFLGPQFNIGTDVFSSSVTMSNGGRILYPATAAGWDAYFRSLSFTSWEGARSDYKTTYETKYPDGPTPIGYCTVGGVLKWVVPVVRASADVHLTISGMLYGAAETVRVGTVSPAYCDSVLIEAASTECTAPEYVCDGDFAYHCVGYKTGRLVGSEIVYDDLVEELSYTFPKGEAGEYYLIWQWERVGYPVSFGAFPAALGTASIAEASIPGVPGYYFTGSQLTLTATPAQGATFGTWLGDYVAAEKNNNPMNLVVDGPKVIAPYFRMPWTPNEGLTSMTDGYWTLPVTGTRNSLKPGVPTLVDASYTLNVFDLQKEIVGGGAFTTISTSWLYRNGTIVELWIPDTITVLPTDSIREMTKLRYVKLPNTLEVIGHCAFYSDEKLEVIEPFLPHSVTNIANTVFTYCRALKCDLVLDNRNLEMTIPSDWSTGTFRCCGLTSLDMTRVPMTQLPVQGFRECANLVWAKLPKTVTELSATFHRSPMLKDIWFLGPAFPIGDDVFTLNVAMPGGRLVYPKGDASWEADIAARIAAHNFTTWEGAGQTNRDKYFEAFPDGWMPVGYTSVGGVNKWLVPHNFTPGTMFFVR